MGKMLVIHINDGVTGYAYFDDQQQLTWRRGDITYPNGALSYSDGDPITMDAVLFEDGAKDVAEHIRSILDNDPPDVTIIEGVQFANRQGYFPRSYELRRLCILSLVTSLLVESEITVEVIDWSEETYVDWYRSRARHLYTFDSVPKSMYELEACAVGLGYLDDKMEVICRWTGKHHLEKKAKAH